jgi:hypothetical protein
MCPIHCIKEREGRRRQRTKRKHSKKISSKNAVGCGREKELLAQQVQENIRKI